MTRRGFLSRLAGAALGLALIQTLPGIAPRRFTELTKEEFIAQIMENALNTHDDLIEAALFGTPSTQTAFWRTVPYAAS